MPAHVHVLAPATTANLGPGFDTAGLALDWWDRLELTVTADTPLTSMQVTGEQAELLPTGADNLVRATMGRLAAHVGAVLPELHLSLVKGFPLGRGFGSSAAAVVLGLLAARALLAPDLPDAEVLDLACELEGHPDNVTPCLSGGATLSWREGGLVRSRPVEVHPDLVALGLVAPGAMATSQARRLLPARVPFADAARTASRAALLPLALAGDFDLLLPATEDVLHQPARLARLPDSARLLERLRARGYAAFLSGAGPSLLVLVPRPGLEDLRALADEAVEGTGWRVEALEVTRDGARATTA